MRRNSYRGMLVERVSCRRKTSETSIGRDRDEKTDKASSIPNLIWIPSSLWRILRIQRFLLSGILSNPIVRLMKKVGYLNRFQGPVNGTITKVIQLIDNLCSGRDEVDRNAPIRGEVILSDTVLESPQRLEKSVLDSDDDDLPEKNPRGGLQDLYPLDPTGVYALDPSGRYSLKDRENNEKNHKSKT